MKNKPNIYLRALKYGDEHPEGFTQIDFEKDLDLGVSEKLVTNNFFTDSIRDDVTVHITGGGTTTFRNKGIFYYLQSESKYILHHTAFFNYQSYLNYLQSDRSSNKAKWLSIFSIALSFITLLISIIFSIRQTEISKKQLESPVEIKQEQIQSIKKSSIDSIQIFEK
jgi:hypothetical protein